MGAEQKQQRSLAWKVGNIILIVVMVMTLIKVATLLIAIALS